jgi:hypothetical protein
VSTVEYGDKSLNIIYSVLGRWRRERPFSTPFPAVQAQDGALLGSLVMMMITAHDIDDLMAAFICDASIVSGLFEIQMVLDRTQ